jgi:pimeloyl-ACP methyl ester carboxylesterase
MVEPTTSAGRELEVNGLRLHVVIEGSGPDVLLLHGFPDSHALWRHVMPRLVAAGYRVIAPDLRGFGESEAPLERSAYRLPTLVADVIGLLDALGIGRARLVGHDWGAVLGWQACLAHPERFDRFAALSVGHPTAYATAPLEQKLKGYYVLVFQLVGFAEWLLRLRHWKSLSLLTGYPAEAPRWIAALSRPGRLTAALNYYRANIGLLLQRDRRRVALSVMGVWSSGDVALCEAQMTQSRLYVDGPWRYERLDGVGHWIPLEAPEQLTPLLLDFLR